MHGLLLRSIQGYVRSTFGVAVWAMVLRRADQPPEGFETMLPYEPAVLDAVVAAAEQELSRPAEMVLEDVGTFLVANPAFPAVRRLLRFGGAGFVDFLHSLEELPDRARLALPTLDLPMIVMDEVSPGRFRLTCDSCFSRLYHVLIGVLRAMADDYGSLVLIEAEPASPATGGNAPILVQVLVDEHADGRQFDLAVAG